MTALPLPAPAPHPLHRPRSLYTVRTRIINRLMIILCSAAALATIAILFAIFGYILYRGFSSLNLALFTHLPAAPDEIGGMRNCIAGTIVLIVLASLIGVPIGILCGVYLAEYAENSRFAPFLRLVVDVLAGVPSIIVGVLAYILVVKPMGTNSAWAGAVALGFMMCPIIARTTEEMLKLVPKSLREASIGLGGSKTQTLVRVILPAASSGIITGIMLAVARVAGETAPLLFTVLGSDQAIFAFQSSFPWFTVDTNHAFPSLTLQIFKYATSAEPAWINQAWGGMVVLITIILFLNLMVRYVTNKRLAAKPR